MNTAALVRCILQIAGERHPQWTLTDYLNTVAHYPEGNDLRWKQERAKARTIVNRELEPNGALVEMVHLLWWEENPKIAGQPRPHPPQWATAAITGGRIKRPVVEPPIEPPATEALSSRTVELLAYVADMARNTVFASRVKPVIERIALETDEELCSCILELVGAMANALSNNGKVISTLDKNSDLYEHRIVELNEKHEAEKRLLAYEPHHVTGGATLHRKQ